MIIEEGNIWEYLPRVNVIAIPTNGVVKHNGELVMGAGLAKDAARRHPKLPAYWGSRVHNKGNIPFLYPLPDNKFIVSAPSKNDYNDPASLKLIEYTLIGLVEILEEIAKVNKAPAGCVVPALGCGYGGLKWEQVEPLMQKYLDDRFIVLKPR